MKEKYIRCERRDVSVAILNTQFDSKVFGQRLKYLRKEHGKTQQDIADLLLVSVDSVSRYENGKTIMGHDYIAALCNYFNISADYFYLNVNRCIEGERWMEETLILLNGIKEEDRKKAYEILRLVFQ